MPNGQINSDILVRINEMRLFREKRVLTPPCPGRFPKDVLLSRPVLSDAEGKHYGHFGAAILQLRTRRTHTWGRSGLTSGAVCPRFRGSVPSLRGQCALTSGAVCPRFRGSVPSLRGQCALTSGAVCLHTNRAAPAQRGASNSDDSAESRPSPQLPCPLPLPPQNPALTTPEATPPSLAIYIYPLSTPRRDGTNDQGEIQRRNELGV